MRLLAGAVALIYGINRCFGAIAAALILVSVLVCAFVAVARYQFGFGRIWIQEIYVAAFGISFMLVAAHAYAKNAHVRVDIFQKRFSRKGRAVIEIIGVLCFLLPWLALITWSSWNYVGNSWAIREPSPWPGGLPAFYLIKSMLVVFTALMALQGLGKIGTAILVLCGRDDLLPREEEDLLHAELQP